MAESELAGPIGRPLDRVDGRLKVTGKATYAFEYAAQGAATVDRKSFAGMLTSSTWTLDDFEFVGEVITRPITDDVAVVAYTVREQVTVDGKPLTLEAADASTWVRRDGRWLCALHTESILGDSFGRDRQPSRPESRR